MFTACHEGQWSGKVDVDRGSIIQRYLKDIFIGLDCSGEYKGFVIVRILGFVHLYLPVCAGGLF